MTERKYYKKSFEHYQLAEELLPVSLRNAFVMRTIQLSLAEDLNLDSDLEQIGTNMGMADITSVATIEKEKILQGRIVAKATGILAGLSVFHATFAFINPEIILMPYFHDSQVIEQGNIIADIDGPGVSLLAGERTALNFLCRMSGIATLTHKFVEKVAGTKAIILDTRKTAPGLRAIDKYAVLQGGGQNHRTGLYDMVLIKDNHIDGAGSIQNAVYKVRNLYGTQYLVEVEVKNLEELDIALTLDVDRIMLDNMNLETMRIAVLRTAGKIPLEASGNVTLETVRSIAETGVNFISIGALTHSAPVLDISMRLR